MIIFVKCYQDPSEVANSVLVCLLRCSVSPWNVRLNFTKEYSVSAFNMAIDTNKGHSI